MTAHCLKDWQEKPITLPAVPWLETAKQQESQAAQERKAQIAEHRIIRAGVDAWALVRKAESFEGWKAIGAALAVGRTYALRVSGSNEVRSRKYCLAFSDWVDLHGFAKMTKSVRSVAIELHENISAIEVWRASLPERERKALVHPLSVTRRWRQSLNSHSRASADVTKYFKTFWNVARTAPPGGLMAKADEVQAAIDWLMAAKASA